MILLILFLDSCNFTVTSCIADNSECSNSDLEIEVEKLTCM